jgi:hypothetical protein
MARSPVGAGDDDAAAERAVPAARWHPPAAMSVDMEKRATIRARIISGSVTAKVAACR